MTKRVKKVAVETEASPAAVDPVAADPVTASATRIESVRPLGSYSPHMVLLYSCGKCSQRFTTGEACPNCGSLNRTHVKTIDACALIDKILRTGASDIIYDVETLRKQMYL